MLVLTRKIGESIIMNGDVKIKILEMRGKQVRIGIEAPKAVVIYREEIYQKILQERKERDVSLERG